MVWSIMCTQFFFSLYHVKQNFTFFPPSNSNFIKINFRAFSIAFLIFNTYLYTKMAFKLIKKKSEFYFCCCYVYSKTLSIQMHMFFAVNVSPFRQSMLSCCCKHPIFFHHWFSSGWNAYDGIIKEHSIQYQKWQTSNFRLRTYIFYIWSIIWNMEKAIVNINDDNVSTTTKKEKRKRKHKNRSIFIEMRNHLRQSVTDEFNAFKANYS